MESLEALLIEGVMVIPGPTDARDKLVMFFKEQKEFINSSED